ncbi:MAG: acyltransferase, partial [Firmicutes bacterium]|nr:acyltransferase [Bacillota bacterium]
MSDKKAAKPRNINLDILRVILCAAVLFYHLGLLKGGYLAVCSFFALSGYLSCRSMLGRDAKEILKHYPARLLKLYLPLAAVVFITLLVVTRLPEIVWLSMKPESTSVLLGYNNFWQIGANLDYFARHTESPFMHFWYIAILLQFELVFPLIYGILRFVEKKISRGLAGFLIVAAAAAATGLFLYMALSGKYSAMEVYYSTQSRVFSLLWGVAACWVSRGREGKHEEKTARGS